MTGRIRNLLVIVLLLTLAVAVLCLAGYGTAREVATVRLAAWDAQSSVPLARSSSTKSDIPINRNSAGKYELGAALKTAVSALGEQSFAEMAFSSLHQGPAARIVIRPPNGELDLDLPAVTSELQRKQIVVDLEAVGPEQMPGDHVRVTPGTLHAGRKAREQVGLVTFEGARFRAASLWRCAIDAGAASAEVQAKDGRLIVPFRELRPASWKPEYGTHWIECAQGGMTVNVAVNARHANVHVVTPSGLWWNAVKRAEAVEQELRTKLAPDFVGIDVNSESDYVARVLRINDERALATVVVLHHTSPDLLSNHCDVFEQWLRRGTVLIWGVGPDVAQVPCRWLGNSVRNDRRVDFQKRIRFVRDGGTIGDLTQGRVEVGSLVPSTCGRESCDSLVQSLQMQNNIITAVCTLVGVDCKAAVAPKGGTAQGSDVKIDVDPVLGVEGDTSAEGPSIDERLASEKTTEVAAPQQVAIVFFNDTPQPRGSINGMAVSLTAGGGLLPVRITPGLPLKWRDQSKYWSAADAFAEAVKASAVRKSAFDPPLPSLLASVCVDRRVAVPTSASAECQADPNGVAAQVATRVAERISLRPEREVVRGGLLGVEDSREVAHVGVLPQLPAEPLAALYQRVALINQTGERQSAAPSVVGGPYGRGGWIVVGLSMERWDANPEYRDGIRRVLARRRPAGTGSITGIRITEGRGLEFVVEGLSTVGELAKELTVECCGSTWATCGSTRARERARLVGVGDSLSSAQYRLDEAEWRRTLEGRATGCAAKVNSSYPFWLPDVRQAGAAETAADTVAMLVAYTGGRLAPEENIRRVSYSVVERALLAILICTALASLAMTRWMKVDERPSRVYAASEAEGVMAAIGESSPSGTAKRGSAQELWEAGQPVDHFTRRTVLLWQQGYTLSPLVHVNVVAKSARVLVVLVTDSAAAGTLADPADEVGRYLAQALAAIGREVVLIRWPRLGGVVTRATGGGRDKRPLSTDESIGEFRFADTASLGAIISGISDFAESTVVVGQFFDTLERRIAKRLLESCVVTAVTGILFVGATPPLIPVLLAKLPFGLVSRGGYTGRWLRSDLKFRRRATEVAAAGIPAEWVIEVRWDDTHWSAELVSKSEVQSLMGSR